MFRGIYTIQSQKCLTFFIDTIFISAQLRPAIRSSKTGTACNVPSIIVSSSSIAKLSLRLSHKCLCLLMAALTITRNAVHNVAPFSYSYLNASLLSYLPYLLFYSLSLSSQTKTKHTHTPSLTASLVLNYKSG